jgi:acyl-ACP thioesterase
VGTAGESARIGRVPDEPLVPEPAAGRVFRGERSVRLGDADPTGRLRFDACARYLHDVSNDDTRDSGLTDDGSWVVRRTVLDVVTQPRCFERVSLATWCGGTGGRWAERRVSVSGAKGGRIESASLWVYVDLATMAPKRLDPSFVDLYGEAAGGRTIGSRLLLPGPVEEAERRRWVLRRTDFDILDHVNNAAYWIVLEELVGERPELVARPHRAVVEFARPIAEGDEVDLLVLQEPDAVTAWLVERGTTAKPHATLRLSPAGSRT